jgi:tetratricopeptide (TPR) repeat protein
MPGSKVFHRARASILTVSDRQNVITMNMVGQSFFDKTETNFTGNNFHQIKDYRYDRYLIAKNVVYRPINWVNAAMAGIGDGHNGGGPIWAIFDADALTRVHPDFGKPHPTRSRSRRFMLPGPPRPRTAQGPVHQSRGDLDSACERLARVRAIGPYFQSGYQEGARCLIEIGRSEEAESVLRSAIDRFADESWALRDYARLAHDRGDWDEAAVRWDALRRRFPAEEAGFSLGAAALKAAGRDAEAMALRRDD